jgi:hypothetical protein
MNDDLLTARNQVCTQGVRAQHGVAARVIGDAQGVEARMLRQRSRQLQDAASATFGDQSSGSHQLGNGDKARCFLKELAERQFLPPASDHFHRH